MEDLLRGIARPEVVAMALTLAGMITFPLMGYLASRIPDDLWVVAAAGINAVLTLAFAATAGYIGDVRQAVAALLVGAASGFLTGNAGHRKPQTMVRDAVSGGMLKPSAAGPEAQLVVPPTNPGA